MPHTAEIYDQKIKNKALLSLLLGLFQTLQSKNLLDGSDLEAVISHAVALAHEGASSEDAEQIEAIIRDTFDRRPGR